MIFAEWLRGKLDETGMTQRELAAKVGRPQSKVAEWIAPRGSARHGPSELRPRDFVKILDAFGCTDQAGMDLLRAMANEPPTGHPDGE